MNLNKTRALWLALTGLALLAGCEARPEIRTQAAPAFNLAAYHTYGFMAKPGTDEAGYRSLTTQTIERAVARELDARGYVRSSPDQQPDLLVNFNIKTHDRVESQPGPAVGMAYGWGWGPYGWGAGLGDYYADIRTVTDGSLTVDLVDRARNEAIWSGTAIGRLSRKVLQNPAPAIDSAVADIFARYPRPPTAPAR